LRVEMETIFVDTVDEVLAHALRDVSDAHPTENGAAETDKGRTTDREQPPVETAPRSSRTLN
jgi:hypothetical protein